MPPVGATRRLLTAVLFTIAAPVACDRAPDQSGYDADPTRLEGAATEIASPALDGSGEPNLFTAGERIYLSWIEPASDSAHALRFAVLEGDTWSPPRTVAHGRDWFVNWADFPSLVELPDGSLAAHWLVRSGPETYAYGVHVALSDDRGATWSEPVIPHRDGTPTEHGFASLFPSPGGLGVVWLDGRKFVDVPPGPDGEPGPEAEMTVRYGAIAEGGALRDTTLLDDRACDCCQTAATIASTGPVVAYRDRSSDEVRDIVVTRLVEGRWTEPAAVHEDGWLIPACPVNGPAIDARGERVAVAWFTAARDTARVRIAFSSDAGATWGTPIEVDDGSPAGRVDVALLEDGSGLVVWLEREEDRTTVRARRVAPDGERGPSVAVAVSTDARASGFPRVALAPGRAVFAWTDPGEPARVRTAAAPLGVFR